jgi:hypothetical protein
VLLDGRRSVGAAIGDALFDLTIHIFGFSPMVWQAASRRKSKRLDETP